MENEQLAQIHRALLGIAGILVGIAFSVSLSFMPFVPLAGLPISLAGWWITTQTFKKTK
jgi:hypothetical protein